MNLLEAAQEQIRKLTKERDAARENFERAKRQRDHYVAKLREVGIPDPLATIQLPANFKLHAPTLAGSRRSE